MCDGKGSATAPSFDGLRTLALHHQSALLSEVTTPSRQYTKYTNVSNNHHNSSSNQSPNHHIQHNHTKENAKQQLKHQENHRDHYSQQRADFPGVSTSVTPTRRSPTPEVIISDNSSSCSITTGAAKNKSPHKSATEKLTLFSRSSSIRKNSAESKKQQEKERLQQQMQMEQQLLYKQMNTEEEDEVEKALTEAVASVVATLIKKDVR